MVHGEGVVLDEVDGVSADFFAVHDKVDGHQTFAAFQLAGFLPLNRCMNRSASAVSGAHNPEL
jgi:hypothetical protein